MTIRIAVGTQWGDEGKGRVVDLMAAEADIVARFNGGDNAGHTVTVGERTFKLHLIPSGVVHAHTTCVLGSGMVIFPETFLKEGRELEQAGVEISPRRLLIAHNAQLITPAHRLLDQAQEAARGKGAIGTTGRGIGPAYTDRAARRGLRVGEMLERAAFRQRVRRHFEDASRQIQALYGGEALDVEALSAAFVEQALQLVPYVKDTGEFLRGALRENRMLLAEAAQGTLLDIDHGTYPHVTSSTTTAAAVFSGLGLGIQPVEKVIGITKAFQTRVGAGAFPTELFDEMALRLRGTGANPWDEFGATTGRPRRVGWLDAVLLRYAVEINGITELALTKLDILSGLKTLKICTGYHNPQHALMPDIEGCTPQYEELPGWDEDVSIVRRWDSLPANAQAYVRRIETLAGVPVSMISVGPERAQVIHV